MEFGLKALPSHQDRKHFPVSILVLMEFGLKAFGKRLKEYED